MVGWEACEACEACEGGKRVACVEVAGGDSDAGCGLDFFDFFAGLSLAAVRPAAARLAVARPAAVRALLLRALLLRVLRLRALQLCVLRLRAICISLKRAFLRLTGCPAASGSCAWGRAWAAAGGNGTRVTHSSEQ